MEVRKVDQDCKIARSSDSKIFNYYFANVTHSLGISENDLFSLRTSDILDSIGEIVKKYDANPSIHLQNKLAYYDFEKKIQRGDHRGSCY